MAEVNTRTESINADEDLGEPKGEKGADGNEVLIGDNDVTPPADGNGRPDWLLDKYESVEDQAKAYVELQKKFGERSQSGDEGGDEGGTPPADGEKPSDATIKKVERAPEDLDLTSVVTEVAENGEISEKTYQKYAGKGISNAQLDAFVAGQQALADKQVAQLAESVGGAETLNALREWAGQNLADDEIEAYNQAVTSGNTAMAKIMLQGIKARYTAENGSAPKLVGGEAVPQTTGAKPFASTEEMVEAMSDSRYKKDPAYRKRVEARVAAT